MIIIGVMSGSSLDGIDIAAYHMDYDPSTEQLDINLIQGETVPLNHIKTLLSRVNDGSALKETLLLENDFSVWIAEQVTAFIKKHEIEPDYLSVHGHTVTHVPERNLSYQLGHGGTIAALTGVPTLTDFRRGDIALGGMGTPLTPLLDQQSYSEYDLVINLGGICNVSYEHDGTRFGYDLFPCNQVLNHFARKFGKDFDRDAKLSLQGKIDEALYDSLITHRLLTIHKPQAIDNSWIKFKFIPEIEYYNTSDKDKMYTFVVALAKVIADQAEKIGAQNILVTGGGTHHPFLISQLTYQLGERKLIIPQENDVNFKETKLMVLLAYLRVTNQTNILASVTGASKNSSGGAIHI